LYYFVAVAVSLLLTSAVKVSQKSFFPRVEKGLQLPAREQPPEALVELCPLPPVLMRDERRLSLRPAGRVLMHPAVAAALPELVA
jgi:hypothetical protein